MLTFHCSEELKNQFGLTEFLVTASKHSKCLTVLSIRRKLASKEISGCVNLPSDSLVLHRYKQVFANKISVFREACGLIFGYKVRICVTANGEDYAQRQCQISEIEYVCFDLD